MADSSQLSVAGDEDESRLDVCEPTTVMCSESHNERLEGSRRRAMANFDIADPELLRSTPANYPLRLFGRALRNNARWRPPSNVPAEGDYCNRSDVFHPWSRPVTWIHEFWSHSWHAFPRQKVLVLLLEYNGLAAAVVGTMGAFVGSGLFAAGVLPGWAKFALLQGKTWEYGIWSVSMGVVFFVPTLLCWRSGRRVFLDKISISQVNEKKKLDGVQGIGAFLKASHCLLVLLDSTYLTRLWCVFEMAAFSKLMEAYPNKVVRFVPLPLGPIFILFFLNSAVELMVSNSVSLPPAGYVVMYAYWLVSVTLFFHMMRRHHDVLAKLQYQLRGFTFQAANCYCCTVGHVHPETGAPLMCDRKAVKVCIDGWFGNSRSFDAFVQGSLFDRLAQGIGRTGIPFRLVLMGCLPVLWGHMDRIAARLRQKAWDAALLCSVSMAFDFLLCRPLLTAVSCRLAYAARRRLSSPSVDAFVSLGMGVPLIVFAGTLELSWISNIRSGNMATLAAQMIALGILTSWVYGDIGGRSHSEACTSGPPSPGQIELRGGVPGDVAPEAD
eukprot:TRINITY_DN16206_c0_g3_i1.p1 TRINITY_DN16206_c0_g3~~TRINITY_DN16206_c0_g3_i1.p1  ORF type:complete len:553 (-),score=38.65 TRINITY_DN16206_c0_g3_i1:133-1791(-)